MRYRRGIPRATGIIDRIETKPSDYLDSSSSGIGESLAVCVIADIIGIIIVLSSSFALSFHSCSAEKDQRAELEEWKEARAREKRERVNKER